MKWFVLLLLSGLMVGSATFSPVNILPNSLADRTFQFTRIEPVFSGTPLKTDALVPNVLVVAGRQEKPELLLQAAQIAYMLGQWTEDPGSSLEKVKQNVNLAPIKFDDQVSDTELKNFNLIVLGTQNRFFNQLKQTFNRTGSFVQVQSDFPVEGRQTLFLSDLKAAKYLANKRLFFKAGAYKSFFAFVKARVFIEKNNLAAALAVLEDPSGIHGCGKPVILALSQKEHLPKQMLQVAQKRNQLVFKELKQALQQNDLSRAKAVWQQTMETCYACHQGQDGVPRFRKFVPNEAEHSYHQKIAERSAVSCQTCHEGKTQVVGY